MPLVTWFGIVTGVIVFVHHASTFARSDLRQRTLRSFLAIGLFFGSLGYGLSVKLDRDGATYEAALGRRPHP